MQFAHIEAFERRFIISAAEAQIHQIFGIDCSIIENNLEDLVLDENDLTICYGKFLCQPEFSQRENWLDYIDINKNKAMFCVVNKDFDKKSIEISYLSYAAIKLYNRDHLGFIPFAAAIYGEEKALRHIQYRKTSQAVECTFRMGKDPIILDIFNRSGVFAIKSIEKRIPKGRKISLDNWLTFVDDDRAISTAAKIF
ncbi:hypothetical protein [Mannheimia haemolytica]|nr:hypothetical protein [Mannheimia haemolytica]